MPICCDKTGRTENGGLGNAEPIIPECQKVDNGGPENAGPVISRVPHFLVLRDTWEITGPVFSDYCSFWSSFFQSFIFFNPYSLVASCWHCQLDLMLTY